jgi:hypothetical protein
MTMAYVFWHTHSKEIPQEAYENNLLAFYAALARVNCPGVRHATKQRSETEMHRQLIGIFAYSSKNF